MVSSAMTVVAVNTFADRHDTPVFAVATGDSNSGGGLYTVAHGVTPPTDFTHAAESTINGVVSIKSYATPRGYGNGYQSTPFDMFDFFFGSPGGNRRQQQPEQREKLWSSSLGLDRV